MAMLDWFKNKEEIYYGVKESEILKYCNDDVIEYILKQGYLIEDLGINSINENLNFIRYKVSMTDILGSRKDYRKEYDLKEVCNKIIIQKTREQKLKDLGI